MGGVGSTRWVCTSTKDTVESTHSLDINRLKRQGWLQPGIVDNVEWTRNGKRVASIGFRGDGNTLILSYRVRTHGGEWRDVEQATPIVWTPCRFGGRRPYFLCPGVLNGVECGRRVTKLYAAGTYFLCRHCYTLAYASQREDNNERALRRKDNIRERLGGKPGLAWPFPERPKGMHHRTYERLASELSRAEMLAEDKLSKIDELEAAARQRAVEGIEHPVTSGAKLVGNGVTRRRYSDRLLIMLLKAYLPDKYCKRPSVMNANRDRRHRSVRVNPARSP